MLVHLISLRLLNLYFVLLFFISQTCVTFLLGMCFIHRIIVSYLVISEFTWFSWFYTYIGENIPIGISNFDLFIAIFMWFGFVRVVANDAVMGPPIADIPSIRSLLCFVTISIVHTYLVFLFCSLCRSIFVCGQIVYFHVGAVFSRCATFVIQTIHLNMRYVRVWNVYDIFFNIGCTHFHEWISENKVRTTQQLNSDLIWITYTTRLHQRWIETYINEYWIVIHHVVVNEYDWYFFPWLFPSSTIMYVPIIVWQIVRFAFECIAECTDRRQW